MQITIVGTGYVGLVTGTCLAEVGNSVVCVDTDARKIEMLNRGEIPIHEPGLSELVVENTDAGKLEFSTDIAHGVGHADVIFIAVGTPPDEDGSADLSHVLDVARDIGRCMTGCKVIVTKSTVPVGTARKVSDAVESELRKRDVDFEFSVASNPEFLKEGDAVDDFMKPDRIVIGAADDRAIRSLRELYGPFNRNRDRVIVMDVASAYPGVGYGGSCFPKDVQALFRTAKENDYDARILKAVEAVNNDQKKVVLEKIARRFGNDLNGKRFAIWGIAFKPDTDDIREAPSRVIMEGLWDMGATVSAFDPVASGETARIYKQRPELDLVGDPGEALDDADALIVVTEWKMFRSPDFPAMKARMREPIIFDGRNIFDPQLARRHGFEYYGIGR